MPSSSLVSRINTPFPRRVAARLALVALSAMGARAGAQATAPVPSAPAQSPKAPDPVSLIFVPYDQQTGPALTRDQSVMVPYAEFLRLKNAAQGQPDHPDFKPGAALAQATYEGRVEGDIARFEATFNIEALARPKDTLHIPLAFEGLSLGRVTLDRATSDPAAPAADAYGPLPEGNGLALTLRGPGARTLRVEFAAAVARGEGVTRSLNLKIPRAAAASFRLRVPEPVTVGSSSTPLSARVEADNTTLLEGAAGGHDRIAIEFSPRPDAAAPGVQTRLAVEHDIQLEIGQTVTGRATFSVEALSGSLDRVIIHAPATVRALGVRGSLVKSWAAAGDTADPAAASLNPGEILITFLPTPEKQTEVALEFQSTAAPRPAEGSASENSPEAGVTIIDAPSFAASGAVRESGRLVARPAEGLVIWPAAMSGVEPAGAPDDAPPGARAFRFGQAGWSLSFARRQETARLMNNSFTLIEITDEFVRMKTSHAIRAQGRGVFGVKMLAPEGYTLLEAGPSEEVSAFRQRGREIDIDLRSEKTEAVVLRLRLQKPRSAADTRLEIEPLSLPGAEEDSGSILLAAPLALKITEQETRGMRTADINTLVGQAPLTPDIPPMLGYRHFTSDARGVFLVEPQRTRLTCDTIVLASITPSLLRVNATLNFNVEFSAEEEFKLLLPASLGDDVVFSGAGIKEKFRAQNPNAAAPADVDAPTTWTIRLQSPALGPFALGVSFEQALGEPERDKPLRVRTPRIRALGVARETGHLGVQRSENLEVRVAASEGLEARDTRELPPALASASLGFRYFDPARVNLELDVIRHELAKVLGALIRRAHIETALSDQREATHEVNFEIQNNREQYLELALPEGVEIWSAFVRGAAVRPTRRESDGARLIELTKSDSQDSAFRVKLVLRETLPGGELGIRGRLRFQIFSDSHPTPINMPVLRTTWRLYLPRDYRYIDFDGTMRRESGGATPWIEPAAERLLNDLPVAVARGVAETAQAQTVIVADTSFNSAGEGAPGATALQIPVVKEGLRYEFSKLSDVGDIEIVYWKRKPLLLLQGFVAILVFVGTVAAMRRFDRVWIGAVALLAAFCAASLAEGFASRMSAASFVGAGLAFFTGAVLAIVSRPRAPRDPAFLGAGPPPPPAGPEPDANTNQATEKEILEDLEKFAQTGDEEAAPEDVNPEDLNPEDVNEEAPQPPEPPATPNSSEGGAAADPTKAKGRRRKPGRQD